MALQGAAFSRKLVFGLALGEWAEGKCFSQDPFMRYAGSMSRGKTHFVRAVSEMCAYNESARIIRLVPARECLWARPLEEVRAMTFHQKFLRVIAWLLIIGSVLTILMGALFMGGSMVPGVAGTTVEGDGMVMDAGVAAMGFGIGFVFAGLIDLIVGILGLRGAKKPEKIMPFLVIACIALALSCINLIMSLVGGQFDMSTMLTAFVGIVLQACAVWCAFSIKKMNA